jgi:hypothetical protein
LKKRLIIFVVVVFFSILGWTFLAVQSLMTKQTTKEEIQKAFPADSYAAFMKSDKLTLYSLKPEGKNEGAEDFHGYSVLGKTEIDILKYQADVKNAFIREMAGAYGAACFNPRHALRAEGNGRTIDVVICFECENFVVYSGDAKGEGSIAAANLVDPFNQVLSNAKIEVAK